jgi:hypothetical protein
MFANSRGRGGKRGGRSPVGPSDRTLPGSGKKSELDKLLVQAKAMGFDTSQRRPSDDRTFSNLNGAEKYSVLNNFIKNQARRARRSAQGLGGFPVNPDQFDLTNQDPDFYWIYVGSESSEGKEPSFSALKHDTSANVVKFGALADSGVLVLKMHLVLRATPVPAMSSPLASITAIDRPGDNLASLALNSSFAVKRVTVEDDTVGYRVTFSKPVSYDEYVKKIRFVVSTAHHATAPWLFVQPWIYIQRSDHSPNWRDGSYTEVPYNVV